MIAPVLFGLWLIGLGSTWAAWRRGRLKSPWHLDMAAWGLLALATLGFFWRVVTGQNWMPADGGDLVSFLFPTYRFAAASIRDGGFPLWNPYLYLGAPHMGDIQAGFLYPPNLLLFLLKPEFPYAALQNLSIAHVWFAGAGMYLLLARRLRVRRVAALAGALAFMFSDVFIVHFGNLNLNAVASWLPWVFWAYLTGLAAQEEHPTPLKWKWAGLVGVLLAISTLAGHIQATVFIVLALGVYTALDVWLRREHPEPIRRAISSLIYLTACLVLMGLLTAPLLLPTLQLTAYTARAGWNYTQAAGYSLSPAQWIGWLIPGFFGRGPQFHWGAWPRVEVGYAGVLTLILAGLGLALRRQRRMWVWAGLAGVSFVLALGIYAIPHGWLTLLPGFGQLRAPARLVLLTDFALAALAALGLDAALRPLTGPARAAFEKVWRGVAYAAGAVLTVGVPLAYLALLLTQDSDPTITLHVSIAVIAVVSFAGLLLASLLWLAARRGDWARTTTLGWLAAGLILVDLASLGAYQDLGDRDPSLSFEQPAIAGYLHSQPDSLFRIDTRTGIDSLWQPDTALLYGLQDVSGVANPLALADVTRYWENMGSRSSRLYDLLNVRYVIAKKDVVLDWDKFALVFDGDTNLNVYENHRALPRAFVVGQTRADVSHEAAWAAIHAADFDPATTAVVEGPAAGGGHGAVAASSGAASRLTFTVNADGPVVLVVSQVWYPGWQVRVDGEARGAPLRIDYIFQGIALEAGSHTVELSFAPPLWTLGWAVAGVTMVALLIAAVVLARRR